MWVAMHRRPRLGSTHRMIAHAVGAPCAQTRRLVPPVVMRSQTHSTVRAGNSRGTTQLCASRHHCCVCRRSAPRRPAARRDHNTRITVVLPITTTTRVRAHPRTQSPQSTSVASPSHGVARQRCGVCRSVKCLVPRYYNVPPPCQFPPLAAAGGRHGPRRCAAHFSAQASVPGEGVRRCPRRTRRRHMGGVCVGAS